MTLRSLAVTIALLLPTPALAQPDETPSPATAPSTAEEWLATGLARYEAGDFKGAIDAFQRGHELDPRPQFLFAIAQAERRRGDCKAAIVYYKRFLTASPPEGQAAAAQEQIDRCEESLAANPHESAPAAPAPAPTVVVQRLPAPPPRAPSPPWYRDGVTVASGGVATAILLTGGAFLLAADGAATEAERAATYDEYADLRGTAESRSRIGVITLSAGAVVGAYTIYRIVRGHPAREAPRRASRGVELGVGPGVGLAIGGAF